MVRPAKSFKSGVFHKDAGQGCAHADIAKAEIKKAAWMTGQHPDVMS